MSVKLNGFVWIHGMTVADMCCLGLEIRVAVVHDFHDHVMRDVKKFEN